MTSLPKRVAGSPALARTLPFLIFLGLTFCQGKFGDSSRYWFYLLKTLVVAWMLWSLRPVIAEMKWALSWEGVAVGIGVFVLWVGLDGFYPSLDELNKRILCPLLSPLGLMKCDTTASVAVWNPHAQFGADSTLAWFFICVRIFGATLVVPPVEEVFFRSFLYRYVIKADFQSVPLGQFFWMPFVATSLVFVFEHHEWLPGILCGFAYQGLVCWKKRLGDAITAHAVTNLLLGLWVVWRGEWRFW
ncbi:MAG: CAAX prenyl protease-related protein [Verrucomicrobia bacterium]|nr:MAG: CAAX prenyl protease-related protein [Verrucomicrobiota bacterium]